jgi:hypothetical protein
VQLAPGEDLPLQAEHHPAAGAAKGEGATRGQRRLLRSLWRDLVRMAKARAWMIPILIEGRERYTPLEDLEAAYPRNFEVLESHNAWRLAEAERRLAEAEQAAFATDALEEIRNLPES